MHKLESFYFLRPRYNYIILRKQEPMTFVLLLHIIFNETFFVFFVLLFHFIVPVD